jgi:hypothetical protein
MRTIGSPTTQWLIYVSTGMLADALAPAEAAFRLRPGTCGLLAYLQEFSRAAETC